MAWPARIPLCLAAHSRDGLSPAACVSCMQDGDDARVWNTPGGWLTTFTFHPCAGRSAGPPAPGDTTRRGRRAALHNFSKSVSENSMGAWPSACVCFMQAQDGEEARQQRQRPPAAGPRALRDYVMAPLTEEFAFRACMAPLLLLRVRNLLVLPAQPLPAQPLREYVSAAERGASGSC